MLRNYLKTSLRNLLRYKSYSSINVFGLTIGLATAIFIFLWVADELRYDAFHTNKGIYRVMSNFNYTDGTTETGWASPSNLAQVMQDELPEVTQVLRTGWGSSMLLQYGNKSLSIHGIYADSTLFSIFSFPIAQGDQRNPLRGEKSIAISQSLAKKLFGNTDALGKVLRVDKRLDLEVTAIFADVPSNSSLTFSYVIPFDVWLRENDWAKMWGNNSSQTFVSVAQESNLEAVNKKLDGLILKNCDDCISHPFLFPFEKLHLYGEFKDGKQAGGQIDYVYSLSLVAIIILIIACINFMNLATARAATRSREVGVRKVIGAQRSGLVAQFMAESVLLSMVAMLLALAIVQLFLPFFNQVIGKSIHLQLGDPVFLATLVALTLFSGLLAGSYPALFLSAFKPATVLKGQAQSALGGGGLRRSLVVAQFIASFILIIGSVVVYHQITYISQMHLGFDRNNVVLLNLNGGAYKNQDAFKNQLLQSAAIQHVAVAGHNPFDVSNTTTDPKWPGKPDDSFVSFRVISCDEDFIPTLAIPMAAGRNFRGRNVDSLGYVINEKAMYTMGLTPETAVGTDLEMWNGKGKIIGVVKDFNNQNLHRAIDPLIFVYNTLDAWRVFIKVGSDTKTALTHIEAVQRKYDPEYPFEYKFLNEDFDRQYHNEAMVSKLALSFTVVAILISCLGLFGLAAFTAERRTKEMGVRKALGASALNLMVLLCRDFARLVFIALVIAFPIAWYLADQYLDGYAFHAQLTVWIFVLPAVGILLLTLTTVGYQSARAAHADPVTALRSE